LFDDFDANANGVLTVDEIAALMASMQISRERKYLMAVLKTLDKNNSGALEYDEFSSFVIYDPYK